MQIVLKLLQILFPFFQKFLYDAILCEYKNNSTSSWICAHCYANRFSNTSSSNSTKYLPWVQLNSIIRIFQTNTIINLYKTVISHSQSWFRIIVLDYGVNGWTIKSCYVADYRTNPLMGLEFTFEWYLFWNIRQQRK